METGGERERCVLIVEDDVDSAEMLALVLETAGWKVRWEPTGRSALRALDEASTPQVVLLDLGLQDMPGAEVARRIRSTHVRPPVILLSGRSREAIELVAQDVGAAAALTKPFDIERLLGWMDAMVHPTAS